ncbi:type II secretion system protein GspN [Thermodesulfobacteriota bacterium]
MKPQRKTLHIIGMTAYALILFILLTFYRMPAGKLFAAAVDNISEGKVHLSMKKISPGLPGYYTLEEVTLAIATGDGIARDAVNMLVLKLDYLNLFKGYLPLKFAAIMPEGTVHGKAGISMINRLKDGYFYLTIEDIELSDLSILQSLLGRQVKGKLDGKLAFNGNLADFVKLDGEGRLNVTEGGIDTRFDLPGMTSIPFKSLKVVFNLKGGMVKLDEGEMIGPMFSGTYSGEIRLNKVLQQSRINVLGEMTPGPMIASNKLAGQLLSGIMKEEKSVKVMVMGTLERPSIIRRKN